MQESESGDPYSDQGFFYINMDAQDAQDNQDGTLLHEKPAPAMIVCGLGDAQDDKLAVSRKILCILCIHVNQNLFPASMKSLPEEFCKRLRKHAFLTRGRPAQFVG